jgi:hypothetical protein
MANLYHGNNKTYCGLYVNGPCVLSDINQIWTYSPDFHKSLSYEISRKFVQWEPRSYMQTDQTDMTKLIGA